jgi:class 3 adenylate cyclase
VNDDPHRPAIADVGVTSGASPNDASSALPDDVEGPGEALNLPGLLAAWRGREPAQWSTSPTPYSALAGHLRAVGEPLLAYDVIQEGLEAWPADLRLRQLLALTLADSGAAETANAALTQLVAEGHDDEETLGMLARTHKDLWLRACDTAERQEQLRLAQQSYERAYRQTGGYWTGINAATLAALQESPSADPIAEEVYARCVAELREAERTGGNRYWPLATLGEASLVLKRWAEAADWYGQAAEAGQGRSRELSSSRRNARLLLAMPGVADDVKERIEGCFRLPPVVMFSGHMVDRPGRTEPRFPPTLEPALAAAIRQRVGQLGVPIAFASAACGADILFLEAVLDLGGEINVILPYDREQFEADSVDLDGSGAWIPRFQAILERATQVLVASERCRTSSPEVYEYSDLLLRGLAATRAGQLDTELRGMAAWDGQPGDAPGGTATMVAAWTRSGTPMEIIDVRELRASHDAEDRSLRPQPSAPSATHHGQGGAQFSGIKAMLFADAVGFSRLWEEQLPAFTGRFLGSVAELRTQAREAPVAQNTWGDGLFFVFDNPSGAGDFALDLCESINASDWGAMGLPPDLNLRIALHAGPVYEYTDPVTGLPNFAGTHVSRAARIEPITPPGQVYASEAFAALCATQGANELICDYVGQTPLAKGYGTFRTYHVRRRPC